MADLYRVGDTPEFVVQALLNGIPPGAPGYTPVTPTGPATVTVYNRQTGATIAGSPTYVISGVTVTVNIPASMTQTAGSYRAAVQLTIDGTPTIQTINYDYDVQPATQ